jgi:hypothetical protein
VQRAGKTCQQQQPKRARYLTLKQQSNVTAGTVNDTIPIISPEAEVKPQGVHSQLDPWSGL